MEDLTVEVKSGHTIVTHKTGGDGSGRFGDPCVNPSSVRWNDGSHGGHVWCGSITRGPGTGMAATAHIPLSQHWNFAPTLLGGEFTPRGVNSHFWGVKIKSFTPYRGEFTLV